jgi:predicted nucleic acid-binding protein
MNAVDTNVLVYAIDHDEPVKQAKAIELLDRLAQPSVQAVLMWQVAAEYLSCLRRWQAIGRITANEVEQYLHRALAVLPLSYPTRATLDISLDLSNRYSLSHWDSMLIGACIEAAVDVFGRFE